MASVTRTAVEPLGNGVGYQLTSHEEWAPDAVKAAWDGTNAAGNFVVAVSYYNDGGALIDRAFPEGVTNAPGDTGRTFFRPFKRGAGGGITEVVSTGGIVVTDPFGPVVSLFSAGAAVHKCLVTLNMGAGAAGSLSISETIDITGSPAHPLFVPQILAPSASWPIAVGKLIEVLMRNEDTVPHTAQLGNWYLLDLASGNHEFGAGDAVTVAAGSAAFVPFTTSSGPNTLLDRTDPTKPALLATSLYAFAANVFIV